MYIYYNNELYHHGVQGQKWGVRNAEWYPIDKWKASLKNKDVRTKSGNSTSNSDSNIEEANSRVSSLIGKAASIPAYKCGSSDYVTTYAIQAVSSIATVAAYVAIMYAAANSHEMSVIKKDYNNRDIDDLASAPKLSKPMSAKDSIKVTNPGYPSEGRTQNCTLCTAAMAMREKGYDVRASVSDDARMSKKIFKETFNSKTEKLKVSKNASYNEMLDGLSKNGDGSYGNLSVAWNVGGGHSVFWKVENGKTRIYDGQSGMEYTASSNDMRKLWRNINTNGIYYNRLDNCEPTEYVLALVERNKK